MELISAGKVLGLSIVTFGVYFFIVMYRHSEEVQALRVGARGDWRVLFWLGFVSLGVTWVVLYVLNARAVDDLREAEGLEDSSRSTAALAFVTVAALLFTTGVMVFAVFGFPPAWLFAAGGTFGLGASIWAAHVNDTVLSSP